MKTRHRAHPSQRHILASPSATATAAVLASLAVLALLALATFGACASSGGAGADASASAQPQDVEPAGSPHAGTSDSASLRRADASGGGSMSEAELLEVAQRRLQRIKAIRGELLERLGRAQALGDSERVACLERAISTVQRLSALARSSAKRLEEATYRRYSDLAAKQAALVKIAHDRVQAVGPNPCGGR